MSRTEISFQVMVESAPNAMILVNKEGRIAFVNRQTELLFGYNRNELIGQVIEIIIPQRYHERHPEFRKMFFDMPQARLMGGGRELFAIKRNGEEFPVEIGLNPLVTVGGTMVLAAIIDITERKLADQKLINATRLFSFLSQINQSIVHFHDQETVFNEACRIAVEYGKFKLAWIGLVDAAERKLTLTAQHGMLQEDVNLFADYTYQPGGAQDFVVNNGLAFVSNDIASDPVLIKLSSLSNTRGWQSCMILPIKRDNIIIATFNIVSIEKNFFNNEEIALLEEAAGDISFAINVFEKEKHRKKIEEKLRYSELRLKQAQSMAHVGNWEQNIKTGIVYWSEECCRIFGFPIDNPNHTFTTWLALVHPDDLDNVLSIIRKATETQSSFSFHNRIIRTDGSIRHVFSEAHFEFDDQGQPLSIFGVVHDQTKIWEAENALARSEANLRLIMDLIPQSIFVKDVNGRFLFANKSFGALYGLARDEIVGKRMSEIIPDKKEGINFNNQDKDVLLSGQTKIIPEQVFTDRKGNQRTFYTTKVPFTVALTNEEAVLGITMDITEQKNAEAERAKMIEDIINRNKDLEQFSYIVSHNLRAPVANISGLSDLLQIATLDNIDKLELIRELGNSVRKLDDVIMDLNDILQIKQKGNRKDELVCFSDLLKDILLTIDHLIKNDDVQVLADFSEVSEMHTFKSYLYSIFLNLITNSIKYRQQDLQPQITIKSALAKDKIILTFSDNGLGIDLNKKANQVFGLYKRFHDHVQGKGMGLFMVKTQVEYLGGIIKIDSEVNRGTTFTLEFDNNNKL